MITTCTGCRVRYRLNDDKVPRRKVRVRCPNCKTVFTLDGTAPETAAPSPRPAAAVTGLESLESFENFTSPVEAPTAPATPAPRPAAARTEPAVAVAEAPTRSTARRRRDKTEMLARALVSDIVVYNREARDRALADGNLLEVLGPEIKKSWELYKEKVGAEAASGTTYFKDALNEILAEGQKLF